MLSSWVGEDCFLWERIHCDSLTGTVDSLNLRGDYYFGGEGDKYLVGKEVNSSLAELRHLKYLDLSWNDLRGSRIPKFIGSFKQLRYLNLSYAGFQGIIPPHIGNLSNLKVLDLSSNYNLTSDDMSWTFGLPSLEHLDLSWVDLGGAKNMDMVLYNLLSLKELSLRGCGLSNVHLGPFLNSSRILANIKHLDLGLNSLKTSLPGFFRNMTSLAFLDLSKFNLSLAWNFANLLNMIPSLLELHLSLCGLDKTFLSSAHFNISMLSNIQHLDLSWNSIEGIIPSVFSNMSSLRVLDLSRNMLHSSVPIMANLLELDLSVNQLTNIEDVGIWRQCHLKQLFALRNPSEIERIDPPQNVSECSQYALERLDLSWCLNGTIPEAFGRLTNLRVLSLWNSSLTGPIPESLGRLRFLEVLDLHDNELTGPIPTFLGNLSRVNLSYNQLNGSIPESFGNLAALESLYLQSNHLTGRIPASLGRLVSLQDILLSSNLLNGTIPVSIGQLAKLISLDISVNSLEGVVSEAHFANISMLRYLYASSNAKLTFNVSCEWIPPFQLRILHLSSCNITNGFPQWLRNQRELSVLVLSNASISGPLPTWLREMPVIYFLDLSHNKLNGPLTNLPNGKNVFEKYVVYVEALILVNNIFNESIPRSLCRRTDLRYLDLSRNRLTGRIPKCLQNLQELQNLILSSNLLSGVIPSHIGLKHSYLYWLKLNDNKFTGKLPRELGNLQALRVLDVGDNQLFGNIPHWIGEKLTDLMVLRLHGKFQNLCAKCRNFKFWMLHTTT
ncbi:receptor-like protein EIX1 [Lactuca sativa]|uniref:receptor-like protein EIX1 n=1 Tax=Lactuca sativa TaxID=4236 RepID=UPI0022AE7035|nr:receptor-like protein EIX1 [Lactuca sativa]